MKNPPPLRRALARAAAVALAAGLIPLLSVPAAHADTSILSTGKSTSESSQNDVYGSANVTDGNQSSYWESANNAFPQWVQVDLGENSTVESLQLKLPDAAAWATRSQTIAVLSSTDGSSFQTIQSASSYTFDPAQHNTVSVDVPDTSARYVRLQFSANTGWPAAQLSEFEVWGIPSPKPDLTVSSISSSPAAPDETSALTLNAAVKNTGTANAPASSVDFFLAGKKVGSAAVPALAIGASTTVSLSVAAQPAGSYELKATVDPANTIAELNENNTLIAASPLLVSALPSADLVVVSASPNPTSPNAGDQVSFAVTVKNQGNQPSSATAHAVTLKVLDSNGTAVKSFTGSVTGTIAAGATASPVNLGSWLAANGSYTVQTTIAPDSAENAAKQGNNTSSSNLFVGRGANMPYRTLEAEDGSLGGSAAVLGPNRTVGDLAGEASGRKAVKLSATGDYVQWALPQATNTLVTRFAIPDSADGKGANATISVYVNGNFFKTLDLTSRYSWLYGNETNPDNTPSAGSPRHIYDEANILFDSTVPANSTIRLQKDSGNTASYYSIDFVDIEQVSVQPNPDPTKYLVPAGFSHQNVQDALDAFRQDTTGKLLGVYLPAGDYSTSSKFQVYGKAVQVIGAGPWYTRFHAPADQDNTDIGWRAENTANGSSFTGFAYFGNYVKRIDGPGKVFDFSNVSSMTIDNVWVEHMICMFWASNMDNSTVKNSRIRDTFADGINMTNGSANNRVSNVDARSTGDDSFALFAATDNGGSGQSGNVFENLTSRLTWRAAGLAVYGGQDNTFRNILIADTLVYSGVTVSSLDFGYPMEGFGPKDTVFDGITLLRDGGHFWGSQTFGAIWMFSASKTFSNIVMRNIDIVDPTYSGIMFQTNYSGSTPQNSFQNVSFSNVSISGAQKSGDQFDAKSGFGIWANEMPEPGQGPAVGSATFSNLKFSNNAQDVKNTTSTFTLNILP
ncbi:CARDB domain-containing protein [Psychromicrobium sp. YIM B11713]|uniref:CARDB domain-containing protein n=1 Tax=Psychromicrobium sp. YIM B11713 TaxID=3145233 RepID=UPI00374EAFD6